MKIMKMSAYNVGHIAANWEESWQRRMKSMLSPTGDFLTSSSESQTSSTALSGERMGHAFTLRMRDAQYTLYGHLGAGCFQLYRPRLMTSFSFSAISLINYPRKNWNEEKRNSSKDHYTSSGSLAVSVKTISMTFSCVLQNTTNRNYESRDLLCS